ncbi:MAG: Ig-like domain-containing protein, partial [Candidatus Nanopelagicales bacterium]
FVVQGKGELQDGKALTPGSRVKVQDLESGSLVQLLEVRDAGSPVVTEETASSDASWRTSPLAPSKDFQLSVQAPDGSERVVLFRTRGAGDRTTATIFPDKGTYGVGMPIVIEFPAPVKSRKNVEEHLRVSTSRDIGEASWFWPDSDTVMFRPKDFWPARTTVRVTADLADVEVLPGMWGSNETAQFRIGAEVIMRESLTDYSLKYYKDGKKVATFPISGGMPGWETLNGIKIVHEAYTMKRMVNNAPGANYDVEVPYAMRLTYSGEFMHAAPWNGNIGYANTSHGCTNMRYDDAVWMYNHTIFGDVFITKGGAGGSMSFGDGLGGVWDVPWKDWVAGSALHSASADDTSGA